MQLIFYEKQNICTISIQHFSLAPASLHFGVFAVSPLQGEQFAFYEDWGEALGGKSSPVLCVLDIEGDNVSVLEGVPENISPGQVGNSVLAILNGFIVAL